MSEWKEHNGGPQPVADDVWVHVVDPIEGSYESTASGADWNDARSYFVLNQHLIDAARKEGLQKGLEAFDEARLAVEGDIQKLCDAARLGGIRLGLEAAAREASDCATVCTEEGLRDSALIFAHYADDVLALDPETIAREAVLDQLTSGAQEQNMGYDKEADND